jgi:hypothetical protein
LKEELHKRRVEIGVAQNKGGVKQEIAALILKEAPKAEKRFKNPLDEQIKLIDISGEEERDQELIIAFMRKYAKIWKFLFGRYANQSYSSKGKGGFDAMAKKVSQISLAEITMLLRDHNTYPQLVKKDEI